MSKEVVEVVYGKHEKYEVIKDTSVFTSPKYFVQSSSGKTSGTFSSLAAAVEWAEERKNR